MPYRCLWHGSLFPSGVLKGVPERLHALEMPVAMGGVPETNRQLIDQGPGPNAERPECGGRLPRAKDGYLSIVASRSGPSEMMLTGTPI